MFDKITSHAERVGRGIPQAWDRKAGRKTAPKSYKAALTKLNIEAWRQLKRLAIDKYEPVGELQCEAINLLFAKYGLPQIAKRWMPGD